MQKQKLRLAFEVTLIILVFILALIHTPNVNSAPSPIWQTDFENASLSDHTISGIGRAQGATSDLSCSFDFDGGSSMANVWIEGVNRNSGIQPHGGNRCLGLETIGSAYRNEWNIYQSQFPTLKETLYVSEWFYIPVGQTLGGEWPFWDLFQLSTSNPPNYAPQYSFAVTAINSDNTMNVTLLDRWASGDHGKTNLTNYSYAPIPVGRWFHFEWYSVGTTDGLIKVWIDGHLIIDIEHHDFSSDGYEYYLSTDIYHDATDMATYRMFVDDVAVYNILPFIPTPTPSPSPTPTPTPQTILLRVSDDSHGSVSPEGLLTLTVGQSYSFTATPFSGYKFDHWVLNGINVGSINPYKLTAEQLLTTSNLIAYFTLVPSPTPVPLSVSLLSPRNESFTVNNLPLTVSLSGPAIWIGYSLDGQSNTTILGNTTLSNLADGSHHLVVYAQDSTEKIVGSGVIYFSVTTAQPEKKCLVKIEANNGRVYVDDELSPIVNEAVYEWILNSVHKIYAEPNYTSSTGELMIFSKWSDDNSANPRLITVTSNSTYTALWTLGPSVKSLSVSILSPNNETLKTSDVPLTLSLDGSASWIGYSIDGETNATISGNMTLNGLADGTHNITIYAKDSNTNIVSSSSVYFEVKTQEASFSWIVGLSIIVLVSVTVAVLALLLKFRKIKLRK